MFDIMTIIEFAARIPGIVIAVVLHEYIKALVSTRLGDPVPKEKGRLTLNPLKQMDLFGAVCIFIWGYGWGNPVQTSPIYYKDKKKGTLVTYLMPSAVNLLLGIVFTAVYRFFNSDLFIFAESRDIAVAAYIIARIFSYVASYNIAMALFNIIPVYPLDGHKILNLFLPANTIIKLQQSEKIIQLVLMFAIFLGFIGRVFDPVVNLIMSVISF